jgi:2-dehydro-3-deoxygluconokinase
VTDVVSIGECMVELSRGDDARYGLAVGGDTFNTAVYLARAGVRVAYATRVGDDPYSQRIIDTATVEGVATHLVGRAAGRMPGLYLIETNAAGERSFWYWRDRAPARELFESDTAENVAVAMRQARLVYFSGVTLSLYSDRGLDAMAEAITAARDAGVTIAMDSNYRPRGWGGDLERARAVFRRFWSLATIALPTFDDEQALWNDAGPEATIDRLSALGIAEIVVKNGPAGAHVRTDGATTVVPCPAISEPVDTTAAGDSFNAAYLARRLAADAPAAAALAGHHLAGVVIGHRGALVPRIATDKVLK